MPQDAVRNGFVSCRLVPATVTVGIRFSSKERLLDIPTPFGTYSTQIPRPLCYHPFTPLLCFCLALRFCFKKPEPLQTTFGGAQFYDSFPPLWVPHGLARSLLVSFASSWLAIFSQTFFANFTSLSPHFFLVGPVCCLISESFTLLRSFFPLMSLLVRHTTTGYLHRSPCY